MSDDDTPRDAEPVAHEDDTTDAEPSPAAEAPAEPPPWWRQRRWQVGVLAGATLLAAIAGGALGYNMRLDLPSVSGLEDYAPPVVTQVLADDGAVIDSFYEQQRLMIRHDQIPDSFRQALIAVEDAGFYEHTGIDLQGIARAAWSNLRSFRRAEGGSTLTQQLARSLFLHREKTYRRKVQEMILATEIERQYAKEEILTFYCNQVYVGHGRYGLEAASRHYFDKPAVELELHEAAMIAGLIQRPEALSPFKNPERARARRAHVIDRMVKVGFIDSKTAAEASAAELPERRQRSSKIAPYYAEEVRRWLKARYGDSGLYRSGLEVRTTLDTRMQRIANAAMDAGLRELDRRQGWRGGVARVPEGEDPQTWRPASWARGLQAGRVTDGVVVASADGVATVRVGDWTGTLGQKETDWTALGGRRASFTPGDVPRVRVTRVHEDGTAEMSLEQEPLVEAALVAIEPKTGAVRSLVGGFDFERSEFDRATQARRQTGSAFKPFVFAAALANGYTLADVMVDEPTVFLDPRQPTPYLPRNYSKEYYGAVTLRRALEKSANVATVLLLDAIGSANVIDMARRLGISSDLQPYPSLALGSFEVSLLELTSAYGTFANQGVRVEPHLVEEVLDRSGASLFRIEPEVRDAVSPEIAYLMNRLMAGVITDGTGRAAASLGFPLAGKTGTTDFNTDAWFIGYSSELAVGVWVGFDTKKSLGSRETGALAALPIWREFMQRLYERDTPPEFDRSVDTRVVVVDRNTGLRANPAVGCPRFSEVFVPGTEPTRYCSAAAHQRLRLPYPFHRFPIDDRGRLVIPDLDLEDLMADEPLVYLAEGDTRLEYYGQEGMVSIPIDIVAGGGRQELPTPVLDKLAELEEDPDDWVGTDGRRARVVFFE
jgi:penicillin-binding protein 1A